jgi:holo-ACP synthase
MPLYLTNASNAAITPKELAAGRDARQDCQQEWLRLHGVTLISFTVVAPGPVKDSELTRRIFNIGLRALREQAEQSKWPIVKQRCRAQPSGPEGLLAIDAPAGEVKLAAIALEQSHPLGRLWDIDVFSPQGKLLSRSDFSQPPRSCLLCAKPAALCARKRAHALPELIARMEALLNDAENAARS